jgi:SAM-dependent methyltransferase
MYRTTRHNRLPFAPSLAVSGLMLSAKGNTMLDLSKTTSPVAAPDFAAIKKRQQATWSAGDYAVVGITLQLVGERLCEAVDLRADERVIDVAAGNGNATLAAARQFAEVTSTDYVEALLERGKQRASAERLPVIFKLADAEALPFAEGASMWRLWCDVRAKSGDGRGRTRPRRSQGWAYRSR